MKKYNTRPIGYTGCHPVIAEHLKRGEAIPVLIEERWRFKQFGQMENGVRLFFLPGAYKMIGCEDEKYEMYWPACIIEEVEDDE